MGFYEISRGEMKRAILKVFPDAEAEQHKGCIGKEALPSHLLWMIEEMEGWNISCVEIIIKACCWIGWMYRGMEELDLFTNDDSRRFFREDKLQLIKDEERKKFNKLRGHNRILTKMTR